MDFGDVVGYGNPPNPDFWIAPANTGEGFRESISPSTRNRATVRAFFDAAVSVGAEVLHEPRIWPEYHADYYGASSAIRTGTTSRRSATLPRSAPPARSRLIPEP